MTSFVVHIIHINLRITIYHLPQIAETRVYQKPGRCLAAASRFSFSKAAEKRIKPSSAEGAEGGGGAEGSAEAVVSEVDALKDIALARVLIDAAPGLDLLEQLAVLHVARRDLAGAAGGRQRRDAAALIVVRDGVEVIPLAVALAFGNAGERGDRLGEVAHADIVARGAQLVALAALLPSGIAVAPAEAVSAPRVAVSAAVAAPLLGVRLRILDLLVSGVDLVHPLRRGGIAGV